MKKISILSGVFAFIAITALYSCTKQVREEVEGKWMKEAFVNSYDSDSAIWTFNNGTLIVENLTDSTKSDTGQYLIVEKKLKNFVRVVNTKDYQDQTRLNGDWQVIQYKKDKLTLVKEDVNLVTGKPSGNVLREFTRIE